ncbi:hypothetical protein RHMOL_Rhmol10G0217800 [Rhododendron molle]|uniref:Uncharacterized protein n=1 Tax=Rhododendron molle TaxID=49168 RepID=A0ACC0M5C3_RHOML|nr:hypothetical protein RHMOL_Rhmol10G0217800 [Rhododendron molle]
MIEIRDKIFHEVFGEDGHGYCLTYGSGVPRSAVYQKNAGPSEVKEFVLGEVIECCWPLNLMIRVFFVVDPTGCISILDWLDENFALSRPVVCPKSNQLDAKSGVDPLSINTMTSRTPAAAKRKAKTKGLRPESSSRVVWNAMKCRVVQTDSEDEGVPVENSNVIGEDMLNRGFLYPKHILMDEFLRDHHDANWGVLQMDHRKMKYFYGPWSPIYPRLVHQFWQNVSQRSKHSAFSTVVDGHVFSITRSLIAKVIKCPSCKTQHLFDPEVGKMDLHDVNIAVCDGPPHKDTYCRRIDLHHCLLVVDSVIQNVFPSNHKDERRHNHLCALYSILTESAFDVAGVVLNEMNKFIDSRTDDTPIPFGPLITVILSIPQALSKADNGDSRPYQIATNEKDHGRFPKMNETQWR